MEERARHPTRDADPAAPKRGEGIVFLTLILIVAFAPLPLGSNTPISVSIFAFMIGVGLATWAGLLAYGRLELHAETRSLKWPVLIYLGVCAWVFVQWTPWIPQGFADPVWQSASAHLSLQLPGRITVNPDATIAGLTNLLLYGGAFWLAFQTTRSSSKSWQLIRAIAYAGSAYAIYGIAIYMTGNEWVLIYPKTVYLDSLTSTFVNRNSYATFAGLSLLCATASLLDHMRPHFALKHPFRAKLVIIVEELVAKSAFKTLAVLSIAISLFLSASRAGILSSAVGVGALIFIFFGQQRLKVRPLVIGVSTLLVLSSVLVAISGNYFSKRMETADVDTSFAFRNYMYSLAIEAIESAPFNGTGFGTYADVIPAFKEGRIDAPMQRWDKAHNTYLENALELGVPAAVMLNCSILLIAAIAARGTSRRRRNKLLPALGLCATLLVALHSLVDFSLQIPAIAFLYACIMGVAAGQSWGATSSNVALNESMKTP